MTDDARTLDFLEGGGTLTYDPKAPARTAQQDADLERARAYERQYAIDAAAAKTSAIHAENYWRERSKSDRDSLAMSNAFAAWEKVNYPNGAWNFGSLDWGLLPVAVVVVKDLVLLAATGGLDAPNVAKDFKNFKSTVKGVKSLGNVKDFAQNVQAAQRNVQERIDRTAKVFVVGEQGPDPTVASASVADRILGDPTVKNAADIIQNTQDLAASGDIDAQRGVMILARVAGARVHAGLAPGTPLLPPKSSDQAAQIALAMGRDVRDLSGSERETLVGNVRGWWQRFVDWVAGL